MFGEEGLPIVDVKRRESRRRRMRRMKGEAMPECCGVVPKLCECDE